MAQNPRNKAVIPTKQSSSPALEKRRNLDNPEKTIEVEEVNKNMQNFNFENELCKIKIPMPFIELIKNPCYNNSVFKMMGSIASQIILSYTVNLQEEHRRNFIGSALS